MARKRHSAEQIINRFREAEVHLSQGMSIPEVSRTLGVTSRPTTAGGRSTAGEGWIEPIRYIVGFVRELVDRHATKDPPTNPIAPGEGIGLVGGDAEKPGTHRHACG
jgi:hypothetical protein